MTKQQSYALRRYRTDVVYQRFVDSLVDLIAADLITGDEVRSAVDIAEGKIPLEGLKQGQSLVEWAARGGRSALMVLAQRVQAEQFGFDPPDDSLSEHSPL